MARPRLALTPFLLLIAASLALTPGCVPDEAYLDAPEVFDDDEDLTRTISTAPWRTLNQVISQGLSGRVALKSAKDLSYTHVRVLGNSKNVRRIYFVNHGDHTSDYVASTAADRSAMAKNIKSGEGALVVYPISKSNNWPLFSGGKNGGVLLAIFRELEQAAGTADIRFEMFSLSGSCRLTYALLKLVNNHYATDSDVRDFVDDHLRGIHNGDSFCNCTPTMHQQYMQVIQNHAKVRFCFVHSKTSSFHYMYKYHAGIAKAVGNKSLSYGGSLTLQGGRLRFWQGASHFRAWKGQFNKVFFGTTWGEGTDTSNACYQGGRQGTCQPATQACAGTYGGMGCTKAGEQCCVPKQNDNGYGACSSNGKSGSCQSTGSACSGYFEAKLCPGPNDIQCCLPGTQYGACSSNGKSGSCQSTSSSCGGYFKAGLCPGASSIKCCLPGTQYGACSYNGKAGSCQSTSSSCSGSFKAGLCPGPNSIKCCLE